MLNATPNSVAQRTRQREGTGRPDTVSYEPNYFWKWILIKMTHQSGQLFLKEEIKWDQKQLKEIRLAVSFLRNCILKILILNHKYM